MIKKKKWQLQVKLLRKLFGDVIGIKVIHIYGCGYKLMYSQQSLLLQFVLRSSGSY